MWGHPGSCLAGRIGEVGQLPWANLSPALFPSTYCPHRHTHAHTCTCCTDICVRVHTHTNAHTCAHMHMFTHRHTYTLAQTFVRVWAQMGTHTCTCVRAQIHVHPCVHTRVHRQTRGFFPLLPHPVTQSMGTHAGKVGVCRQALLPSSVFTGSRPDLGSRAGVWSLGCSRLGFLAVRTSSKN